MKKLLWLLLLLTSTAYGAELKQEVNIASRVEKDSAKIGKSTEVLDPWLLDAEKPTFLNEALWNVEGIHVKRLSGAEGTLSIYSRGMRSTDSVLVFGGVKFRDPSDTQGSSNPILSDILLTSSDNIEVVKGSSASFSGSTSQGALIDVSRPYSMVRKVVFSEEIGSGGRFMETLTASDKNYRFDGVRLDSDRYDNTTVSGSFKVGVIEPFFYHIDSVATLHDPTYILGGVAVKDSVNSLDKRESDIGLYGVKSTIVRDNVEFHNILSLTETDRRFNFGSFDSDGSFGGKDWVADSYIIVNHSGMFTSSIGVKYENETLNISQVGVGDERNASQSFVDFYGEERVQLKDLSLLLQGRASKGSATYDLSATYPMGGWQIASHLGTGFRNPSLYERYGAILTAFGIFDLGNPELSPEKSYTWDGTVKYSDKVNTLGVTPFISHISNPIVLETAFYTNSNVDRNAHGIEAFYERYMGHMSYRANYTYTTGEDLLDIPTHEVGNSIIFHQGSFLGSLRVAYQTSKKYSIFSIDTFTGEKLRENGGIVVGATANYKVSNNMDIFIKLDNALDRTYTDGGYIKNGIEVYGGVKITL